MLLMVESCEWYLLTDVTLFIIIKYLWTMSSVRLEHRVHLLWEGIVPAKQKM